jgi:hypothetical protein
MAGRSPTNRNRTAIPAILLACPSGEDILFSVQRGPTAPGPPPADRRALGPAPAARPARSAASAIGTVGQRAPTGARLEQVEKV